MRNWLKDLRAEKKLTCKELGRRIGKSEPFVYMLETGERYPKGMRVDMVIQIAEAVGADAMKCLQAEIEWLHG